MFTSEPRAALAVANDRARQLRESMARTRLPGGSRSGFAVAASLRRVADRLTPVSLERRPA